MDDGEGNTVLSRVKSECNGYEERAVCSTSRTGTVVLSTREGVNAHGEHEESTVSEWRSEDQLEKPQTQHTQKKKKEAKTPVQPRRGIEMTPLTNFFERLKLLYNDSASSTIGRGSTSEQTTATAAAAAATSSSFSIHAPTSLSPSSVIDFSCHCLVVDSSKLNSGSADETHLNQALALLEQRDRNKVLEFVHKQWSTLR